MCSGREFQIWAAATGKARLPTVETRPADWLRQNAMPVDQGHQGVDSTQIFSIDWETVWLIDCSKQCHVSECLVTERQTVLFQSVRNLLYPVSLVRDRRSARSLQCFHLFHFLTVYSMLLLHDTHEPHTENGNVLRARVVILFLHTKHSRTLPRLFSHDVTVQKSYQTAKKFNTHWNSKRRSKVPRGKIYSHMRTVLHK